MKHNMFIKPSILEMFVGPMYSGKSQALIHRIQNIEFIDKQEVIIFKPEIDTRNPGKLYSRGTLKTYDCITIAKNKEKEIYNIGKNYPIIVIDETQFFNNNLVGIVEKLIKENKNVIVGGLDLNFYGNPFEVVSHLMGIVNDAYITKLSGVCMKCKDNPGTRSQLLINGKPAPYGLDTIRPQDKKQKDRKETYEIRCMWHHEVPKRNW